MAITVINGVKYTGRNISITNGQVIVDGVPQPDNNLNKVVEVRILEGTVQNLKSDASITAGLVMGNVQAGNSVSCDDVNGSIQAGNSVTCGKVGGSVIAGGSVTCRK